MVNYMNILIRTILNFIIICPLIFFIFVAPMFSVKTFTETMGYFILPMAWNTGIGIAVALTLLIAIYLSKKKYQRLLELTKR